MNGRILGCVLFLVGAAIGNASDEIFDRVEDALTWSAADTQYRSRISGSLDLEGYLFPQPAPGLLYSDDHVLFNPRLTFFYDAQIGSPIYIFAQARMDRGFDPGAAHLRGRLDEYAIRLTPWRSGRFNLQVGKFATVVGNWVVRHGSWTNPFITAPLAYENLTGMWDSEAVRSSNTLLQWSHVRRGLPANVTAREKSLRIPIIWGPSYATGAAISGEFRRVSYALEVKEGAVSSRPEAWGRFDHQWEHPTASGRFGYRPNQMWNFGVSASTGTYLQPYAQSSLPAARNLSDYRQTTLAHDLAFAWRHLQVWAEVTAARFQIPGVGDADTLAWYAEAKYKVTPRLSGAVRWNQQVFSRISDRGAETRWGRNLWRLDVAPAWRFTSHTQAKLQYSLQEGGNGTREYSHVLSTQLTVRF